MQAPRAPEQPPEPLPSSASSSSASSSAGTDWVHMEPPAAIECAEWIHGPLPHHRVHFVLVDGTSPICAQDVTPDPDGYGVGLADLRIAGRTACKKCCRRLGTILDELEAQMHALTS